jgi:phospholipid/cholesterol/gamma-HCH transport system permease protein
MTNAARQLTVVELPGATLQARLAGSWRLRGGPPDVDPIGPRLDLPPTVHRVTFDAGQLSEWDSSLLVFLERALDACHARHVEVDLTGLPEGVRRLMALAEARPGGRPPPAAPAPSLLARIGEAGITALSSFKRLLRFIGEVTLALGRFLSGRARYRRIDLLGEVQRAGAGALWIVVVVAFLLGMILAFVGDVTLSSFGASIYVANVVTVGMVRELGPVMTAIVMAGRTGSAYAAQIGTMKVTEEIDALTTMGLSPMDFLVLPRVLALSLMLPLLCVQADFVAMIGGAVVAVGRHTGVLEYLRQSRGAIDLRTFWIGMFKAAVFGVVVAMSGCLQGLKAGRSAAAVGGAATAAVVTSIVWIIALDGVFAVLLHTLGI